MERSNGKSNGNHSAIWNLREERNFSQRDLAELAGISRGRLRRLENGSFEEATFGELKRIAETLKVDFRDFLAATGASEFLLPDLAKAGQTAFQLDLPQAGTRIVSAHLPRPDFFSGKLWVAAKKRIAPKYVPKTSSVLIQVLLGRLRIEMRQGVHEIEEGDSFVFPGDSPYAIENPALRDSLAQLITVPSFTINRLSPSQGMR